MVRFLIELTFALASELRSNFDPNDKRTKDNSKSYQLSATQQHHSLSPMFPQQVYN